MIRIEHVRIVEFRGIRDLELELGGDSYVVWGPNGSGKSGVVDALDFALTGDISRLRGAGSGGVSLLKHGPHVDRRDDPGAAFVEVTVADTASGDVATMKRSIKSPNKYTLVPDLPSVRKSLERTRQHPELMLSRREIIKYIVAESGKRATEIQALLKLERVGEIRSAFRSTKSKTATIVKQARSEEKRIRESLQSHFGLSTLLESEVLAVVNGNRLTLGLQPITSLDQTTDFAVGLVGSSSQAATSKASIESSLTTVIEAMADWSSDSIISLSSAVGRLEENPDLLGLLKSRSLVLDGLELVEDRHCPLCGQPWESIEDLVAHLQDRKDQSALAAELQDEVMSSAAAVASELRSLAQLLAPLASAASRLRVEECAEALGAWSDGLIGTADDLSDIESVRRTCPRIVEEPMRLPASLDLRLDELGEVVAGLPDPSATDAARAFLTVAKERMTSLRLTRLEVAQAEAADAAAEAIYDCYCAALDQGLAALYVSIEERLGEFYRFINSDDEGDFKASLAADAQSLDLLVDFHGEGMFPPVAYHSEGHQDGMGVCLYLALMEQLLGGDFQLAVLDDVVMSVDVNHRRQFCALLKQFFPSVQFVVTTHDEVWARQMQQTGLVAKARQSHFVGWSVETGPVVMEGEDFWDRIYDDLERNDVSSAAARLRRNMEARLAEIAEQLGGQVPYRSSGSWDLGEYLNAVKGRYSKLIGKAAKSANDWGNAAAAEQAALAKNTWDSASLQQTIEQWAMNPAVHYNEWANFTKEDFSPVVASCREFLAIFECPQCQTQIRLSKVDRRDDALKCSCGTVNLNLLRR